MIPSGGKSVHSEIHRFISSTWKKEESHELWVKSLLYLSLRNVVKEITVIMKAYHCHNLYTHFTQHYSLNTDTNAQ